MVFHSFTIISLLTFFTNHSNLVLELSLYKNYVSIFLLKTIFLSKKMEKSKSSWIYRFWIMIFGCCKSLAPSFSSKFLSDRFLQLFWGLCLRIFLWIKCIVSGLQIRMFFHSKIDAWKGNFNLLHTRIFPVQETGLFFPWHFSKGLLYRVNLFECNQNCWISEEEGHNRQVLDGI